MDRTRLFPWVVRALWATLPFLTGPAFASAFDGRSISVRTVASVGLWGAWVVALAATLFLHPISLTLLRTIAPAGLVAAVWAASRPAVDASGLLAVAATAAAGAVAYLPETGVAFVNGPAYPNERRYPLRVPGALLFGPAELAWLVTVGAPVSAALLLAARQWVPGAVATLVAGAAGWYLGRALHGLSRRWIVFVPAGLVLHDPMTLADPVLFPKLMVASVELAEAGTEALDLTQGSPGLALELRLREEASLVLTKPGERIGPTVSTAHLLFTPTRPGRVLGEVRERMRGGPPGPPD